MILPWYDNGSLYDYISRCETLDFSARLNLVTSSRYVFTGQD